jgi:hypothetical protein
MATYLYTGAYDTVYAAVPITAGPTRGTGGTPTVWDWGTNPPTDGHWTATGSSVNQAADNTGPGNTPPTGILSGEHILSGTGAPPARAGNVGDFWLDTAAGVLYGPLTGTGWPTPGTPLVTYGNYPADQGLSAWTYDPNEAGHVTAQTSAGVAGRITLTKLILRTTITWSRIWYGLAGVDAGAVLANCYLGVYNAAGTRVGVSPDLSADLMASAVAKPATLTAPFTAPAGEYYIAMLLNGTWTTNNLTFKASGAGSSVNANLSPPRLRYSNMLTAQTALPATLDLTQQTSTIVSGGWGSQWYGIN